MYGQEACYGIVSQPKSTRSGINTYLEGYLKEENMLFRDKPIKFEPHPPFEQVKKEQLTSWTGIKQKLGKFNLEAPEGTIFNRSVCGILGENGIGKTSLIKILAGVSKPDEGKTADSVAVSYKPQYIDSESEELVMTKLQKTVQKYDVQLIRPLNIKPLLMKKINELSGGELQRVAIAECLSNDAELYLLDEPSAFLDVEQRLIVSKILRNMMIEKGTSALVIDHDLLFIDYLSDGLMVFDGVPAVKGIAKGPFSMEDGMNNFLKDIDMTFRRDPTTHRPRANKPNSQMDRKQKAEHKLYYTSI
jgi:ATP-binding cassette subfamily E protein 1